MRIASGLAAVLNATTPLFTLLIARVFAGEALTANKSSASCSASPASPC